MHYLLAPLHYIVPFLAVLTILIFVHEFGHYWVARQCGVKIDSFSIGFGRELFGWTDKKGTRWKLSLLPLGGYVKMFGDGDETSWNDTPINDGLSEEERKSLFANKPLWARAAVVAAGPAINFLFTIVVLSILFMTVGERFTTPEVSEIVAGSAAESAGIQPGDVFTYINGHKIRRFEDIQEIVQLHPGEPLTAVIKRGDSEQTITATPEIVTETSRFGTTEHVGRLGIRHNGGSTLLRHDPISAVGQACGTTWDLVDGTMTAIWQMIKGTRPADQMGGVISIAKMSGDTAKSGIVDLIYFMALLSVNLGLLNLFPIPVLDGGHLLFYAVEAVNGKPLGEAVMKYSFRLGLALVLTLAIFANWNDLVHLGFISFVRDHIS